VSIPPEALAGAAVKTPWIQALQRILSPGQLRGDTGALTDYGHDESDYGQFPPRIVALPHTAAEVSEVLRLSQRYQVPVTPCGARSGKSGGSIPVEGGIALSLERMNRIKSISIEDLIAVVEPGVITGELMKAVEAKGLFYPPDPNSLSFCTMGGNVAENAGGPRALKYGVTRDYVLGLEWVLPNGEIVRVGRQTIKGVAGYDLVGLFVGSEGTLGVATEITVQLLPLPKRVRTALVLFSSVFDAAKAVSATLAQGILPRCLELLDEVCIRAVNGYGFHFPEQVGAALLAEVDGNVEEALLSELSAFGSICEAHGAVETLVAEDEQQREKLWSIRRELSNSLRRLKPYKASDDVAVPRSRIPEAIQYFKQVGDELGLVIATYGHAGDGNLHANLLFDGPNEQPTVDQAVERILKYTVSVGGTITGEHGIGIAKRAYLPLEQTESLIQLQRSMKHFFDPSGLLNPGKIFPPSKG
jgi:glycolate oxidase